MKTYFSGLRKYSGVILTCCCFYPCSNIFSQILVSPGGAPSTIINSFVGAGLSISNVQFICGVDSANAAYGTFSNGLLGLGLSQGIVLSTGSADNLVGPNLPGDSSTTGNGSHYGYQDPHLIAIAGDTIADLCVLEFDVVPHCTSLQIKFVFGSEEYPEFVNAYNDAFGFFVTGPNGNCDSGFYNNTNVAQLPDGTPITVNNVNDGFSLGCPSVLPGPCQQCSYYVNNCYGTWVEYDGFTTVITVNLSVCACATYHWKFAIADTRDALYDSGVMIETFACNYVPLLIYSITSVQTGCICNGSATVNILSGTPPFSFLWSGGQTTQTVTNLCAGTYSVQVMDSNSCNTPITGYITIEQLAVTVNTSNVTCHGLNNGTATAFADGGTPPYSFVWNTVPPQTTAVASNLDAGTYTVNVTDSSGCTSSTSAVILEPDTFFIQIQDTVYTICQFNSASLIPTYAGGTVPLTYLWNTTPPVTFPYVFGLGAGMYTVIATDANGCTASASATVLNADQIVASDTTMCEGDNILIEVFGANTYSWSPPDGLYTTTGSFQYAHPTVTTTYTIIGYCPSGPLDTAYLTVTVLPSPNVTATPSAHVCYGDDVTLQASGALRYTWQPDYYIISYSPDSSSIIAHPTNTVNFVLAGYNAFGCSTDVIIPVSVQEENTLIINSTGPTIFCEGDETILYAGAAGNYLWSTGETTASIVVTESGTYSVTVTDVHGCNSTSLPVLIVVYPPPVPVIVSSGPAEYCAGEIISIDLNVGTADHYLWSTFENTQSIHVTTPGQYSVTVTDDRNCTAMTSIDINLHAPSVDLNLFSLPTLCEGTPAQLFALSLEGIDFLWSNGVTGPSVITSESGTYTVTVTDIYSCSVTASQTLNFNPLPEAVISPAGPISVCSGLPQTLQANSGTGYSYQWYHNNVIIPGETNQMLTAAETGSYSVKVTNAAGCSASSSYVELIEGTGPEVSVSTLPGIGCRDNIIYTGYGFQNVTLTAVSSLAVSFLWSTGETTQTISVNSAGTFSVTAFDAAGCPSAIGAESQIIITEMDIRCGHNLQKIILCHVPEGNPANPQTICIAPPAINPHLSLHEYDCLGPCPESTKLTSEHDDHDIVIYPNPVKDELSVMGHLLSGKTEIEIYDILGQTVFSQKPMANSRQLMINVSSLTSGIYFLRVTSEQETFTGKFVKSN